MALRLAPTPAPSDLGSSLEYHLEGLQALRYRHYLKILEENQDADPVMLTDVRDVAFQADPFAQPITGLEIALEDESVRVGQDVFNTRWLTDLYGPDFVRRTAGRVIACSGTTFGRRGAMLEYLRQMIADISRRRRPMGPRDQGVHNALVLSGRLPEARLVGNGHGRVLTMGAMSRLLVDAEGLLLNADGTVPAVVHQWDRHGQALPSLWLNRFFGQD
jgi:hypothetical protein